jgi:uncharacterized damage-inducible protein DinB
MTTINLEDVPQFFQRYVSLVKDQDMLDALKQSSKVTLSLIRSIPESKGEYRYAEGKWTIKEMLAHMLDAERIFAYRALRFARNDKTALPGFEENDYAPQANAHGRTVARLADELERVRLTTIDLFSSFTPDMLQRTGTASNKEMSVLTMGYVISGHESHHRNVLTERYLKP